MNSCKALGMVKFEHSLDVSHLLRGDVARFRWVPVVPFRATEELVEPSSGVHEGDVGVGDYDGLSV